MISGKMLRGSITELSPGDMLELFDTNVVAGMRLTGLAVPHLARVGGAVVSISSGGGLYQRTSGFPADQRRVSLRCAIRQPLSVRTN